LLSIIRCRILCLPVCYLKNADQDIGNYNFVCCVYGCETWSMTLREQRRLMVFENKVLRRIFELKREDITGEGRRLHDEELNDL